MAEARDEAEWRRTASVMAHQANLIAGLSGSRGRYRPDEFMPRRRGQEPTGKIADFKARVQGKTGKPNAEGRERKTGK